MTAASLAGLNSLTWPYSRLIGEVNQSTTRRFYPSVCLINDTALQHGSPKSEIYSKNKT